ncbi:hypothetical protein GUJ93_ZPchr0001g30969 [Zizania palustris]|uniref:Uncharacterized protein n=1 Tax=Zizania palustris TaxID=103762 RepID=A0A8J5S952_ZIZPA|nr:hypothetical protein GUJ93_ZPchr0001g30969 [Zizania palustris]
MGGSRHRRCLTRSHSPSANSCGPSPSPSPAPTKFGQRFDLDVHTYNNKKNTYLVESTNGGGLSCVRGSSDQRCRARWLLVGGRRWRPVGGGGGRCVEANFEILMAKPSRRQQRRWVARGQGSGGERRGTGRGKGKGRSMAERGRRRRGLGGKGEEGKLGYVMAVVGEDKRG